MKMHIKAERTELNRVLAALKGIVEKRNTIPILANILLAAKGDKLRLKATDLDLEVTDSISVEVVQPGEITVPAALLADIVKKLPAGSQIELKTDENGGFVTVSSGRSRFKLQALPASDFPDITIGVFSHAFTMTGAELGRLLARTSFAISSEETRYYLNGIHLRVDETMIAAVGTDGHRLGLAELALPAGAEGMPGIIIPKKAVHEVAKLTNAETIGVEVSDAKIRFTIGSVVLTSKLIDGTFPDYRRVIPQNNEKEMTVEKSVLAAAVDRVTTISS